MVDGTVKQEVTVSSEVKIYSVLAYFGVLCLVALLANKGNDYVKFHAKQGIVLFVIETIAGILTLVPILGHIAWMLVMLICGILSLLGMIQALMGNKWDIPFIADWARKITL